MCLLLRAMVSYFIAKSFSVSTAPVLGIRSRTCPYEARISKSLPRYFCSVLALAGDSTISKLVAMRVVLGLLATPGLKVSGDERLDGERQVSGVSRTLHTIFGDGPISRNWYRPAAGDGR